VFSDVTPGNLVDRWQRFGGTCCLILLHGGHRLETTRGHILEEINLRSHHCDNSHFSVRDPRIELIDFFRKDTFKTNCIMHDDSRN
jgi:hypothetical protein